MAQKPNWPVIKQGFKSPDNIRALQCLLNFRTQSNALSITGTYNTSTYKAVIAFQKANNLTPDGIVGESTFNKLISNLNLPVEGNNRYANANRAAQYLLKKFTTITANDVYSDTTKQAVKSFRTLMGIRGDGIDATTWQYLFGYYFYPTLACDTATTITAARLQLLKDNGYAMVGRYLPGASNPMTLSEKKIITEGGLYLYSIWEKGPADNISYYTASQGTIDARKAIAGATTIGQPHNTPIYFAVDCDVTSSDINGPIRAYLNAIKRFFDTSNPPYELGLYGPGAVLETFSSSFPYTILACAKDWNGYNSYAGFCMKQYTEKELKNTKTRITIDPNDSNGFIGGWKT
ncbi:MAG: DUF1906 domain-containing protein, partial [Lachnospiraceae bacterium]|nr:DUF1906 domain-containing protein [Lachnospiraceae bacterium]